MLTYNQFFIKYTTQSSPGYSRGYWDFDGYYGAQCMDLIQFYAKELGLPRFHGNAADVANQYPAGWTHVRVPIQGDVVVFDRSAGNGFFGHIAISDRPYFYLSQNYPTGTNTHVQYINEKIIAILRPSTLKQGGDIQASDNEFLKDMSVRYLNGFYPNQQQRQSGLFPDPTQTVLNVQNNADTFIRNQIKNKFQLALWRDPNETEYKIWTDRIKNPKNPNDTFAGLDASLLGSPERSKPDQASVKEKATQIKELAEEIIN